MMAPALSEPQQQHLVNIGIVELITQQAAQDLSQHRAKSDIVPSNLKETKESWNIEWILILAIV